MMRARLPALHRTFLGVAAGTSVVACLMAAIQGSALGAVFAAASGVLVLTSLAIDYRRGSSANQAQLSKAAEQAETGRRLAIYERETGLLAHWYVTLRGKEECERAARYRRPMVLLLAEIAPDADPRAMQGQLPHHLTKNFRKVDIIGYLGNGRYVVLMPESDMAGGRLAASRLQSGLSGVDIGLSELPTDGTSFDQLYAAASQRLGKPIEQAA
jgi:hypothetical protein